MKSGEVWQRISPKVSTVPYRVENRTHDLCVANRTTGKTLSICLSKVAATKRNQWFSCSFPFLTIAYTSRPVFFGHVLAI